MERDVIDKSNREKEPVILHLHGIDKKWVRSKTGEWVDMAKLHRPEEPLKKEVPLKQDEPAAKKKWWKFW